MERVLRVLLLKEQHVLHRDTRHALGTAIQHRDVHTDSYFAGTGLTY